MKTFRVKASEQVFYQEDIDAKNEEEAIEKFKNGYIEFL